MVPRNNVQVARAYPGGGGKRKGRKMKTAFFFRAQKRKSTTSRTDLTHKKPPKNKKRVLHLLLLLLFTFLNGLCSVLFSPSPFSHFLRRWSLIRVLVPSFRLLIYFIFSCFFPPSCFGNLGTEKSVICGEDYLRVYLSPQEIFAPDLSRTMILYTFFLTRKKKT